MPENVLWSGHVTIIDDGKKRIIYKADNSVVEQTYTPDGFFENKAVNGLVDKLK